MTIVADEAQLRPDKPLRHRAGQRIAGGLHAWGLRSDQWIDDTRRTFSHHEGEWLTATEAGIAERGRGRGVGWVERFDDQFIDGHVGGCADGGADAEHRQFLVAVAVAQRQYDPVAGREGIACAARIASRAAIDATIGAVQGQFPGLVFTLAGPVDAHHRQARFSWGLGPEGTEPLVVGFDVAVTDDQDKITTVLGFLDKVPG